ncbi:MAG: UvrB/UvrC motif-containing protein [Thermoguttaceae bacterium]
MSHARDLDDILNDWPFQPGTVSARLVRAADGREVLQMRVELGVLQMETSGRPDGKKPGGAETCLDWLVREDFHWEGRVTLSDEQSDEIERELSQFCHRRICWLAVRAFDRAVDDANHTLGLLDFLERCEFDEVRRQEQAHQRMFAVFHRTQAAALAHLAQEGAETAIEEINRGLQSLDHLAGSVPAEPRPGQMGRQLRELQDWIRNQYQLDRTLNEQLADAVAAEDYERAARLRDELARRQERRL